MKRYILLFAAISLIFTGSAMAMMGMGNGSSSSSGSGMGMDMGNGMDMGSGMENETFTHATIVGDLQIEFKVMDLAGMNMKDPEGKTHHVMATFKRNGEQVSDVVGKMKLISPSGKEQIASLKGFGGGIFAANFTIDEPGKWGVICVFKDEKEKQTVKFWYPHMTT